MSTKRSSAVLGLSISERDAYEQKMAAQLLLWENAMRVKQKKGKLKQNWHAALQHKADLAWKALFRLKEAAYNRDIEHRYRRQLERTFFGLQQAMHS